MFTPVVVQTLVNRYHSDPARALERARARAQLTLCLGPRCRETCPAPRRSHGECNGTAMVHSFVTRVPDGMAVFLHGYGGKKSSWAQSNRTCVTFPRSLVVTFWSIRGRTATSLVLGATWGRSSHPGSLRMPARNGGCHYPCLDAAGFAAGIHLGLKPNSSQHRLEVREGLSVVIST